MVMFNMTCYNNVHSVIIVQKDFNAMEIPSLNVCKGNSCGLATDCLVALTALTICFVMVAPSRYSALLKTR